MDEFVLFAFLLFTANKSNLSVRFLGESMARRSAFWFYVTFICNRYVDILQSEVIDQQVLTMCKKAGHFGIVHFFLQMKSQYLILTNH